MRAYLMGIFVLILTAGQTTKEKEVSKNTAVLFSYKV
jgi:hypothetical protein